jgi:CBS domain containing-hemolysin-like protein
MQEAAGFIAVVVDEHGGTSGIVTVEDVVAELVGEVADEGEPRVSPIRRIGPDRWLVIGSADADDLSDELGIRLPVGAWQTVGGLVTGMSGSIPKPGDVTEVDGILIRVLDATEVRVETVEVIRVAREG